MSIASAERTGKSEITSASRKFVGFSTPLPAGVGQHPVAMEGFGRYPGSSSARSTDSVDSMRASMSTLLLTVVSVGAEYGLAYE